jgi:hypothetical protein
MKIRGDKNKNAMKIRSAATSSLEYTSIPLFMSMNELPQVNASATSMIQLIAFVFTRQR